MAYSDLNGIHNPTAGQVPPAAWGDQIRDNFEFLIDPPSCSIYNSSAQSLTTSTLTKMTANSENYDNDSMHSTVSNTSRITIVTAGRYLFVATLLYAANATGNRTLVFIKNNTTSYNSSLFGAVSGNTTNVSGARTVVMAPGDYMEVQGYQTSGGNLDCTLDEFVALYLTR